jgi:hypothetical protein
MFIVLSILGVIMLLGGGIGFLGIAFIESLVWGLLCIFVPFANLVFFFMHLQDTWKSMALQIVGVILIVIGGVLGADSLPNNGELGSQVLPTSAPACEQVITLAYGRAA